MLRLPNRGAISSLVANKQFIEIMAYQSSISMKKFKLQVWTTRWHHICEYELTWTFGKWHWPLFWPFSSKEWKWELTKILMYLKLGSTTKPKKSTSTGHLQHPWSLFGTNTNTFMHGLWRRPTWTGWLQMQNFVL